MREPTYHQRVRAKELLIAAMRADGCSWDDIAAAARDVMLTGVERAKRDAARVSQISEHEIEASLALQKDLAAIEAAAPEPAQVAKEIGGQVVRANGQEKVYFKHPSLTVHEQDERTKKFNALYQPVRELEIAIGEQIHGARDKVAIERNGMTEVLPAQWEGAVAKQPGVRPVRKRRKAHA